MPWYIFPSIKLTIGLTGLLLSIRAFKKGESISLKKLFAVGMLIFLGGGIFLQKMKVIDIEMLEQLMLAFDSEEREKQEEERLKEIEDKRNEIFDRVYDRE